MDTTKKFQQSLKAISNPSGTYDKSERYDMSNFVCHSIPVQGVLKWTVGKLLVFGFVLLFPFGQLLRFEVSFLGRIIPILAVDVASGLTLFLYPYLEKPKISKLFLNFIWVSLFSLILSVAYFDIGSVFVGSFYLVRILAYFSFFVLAWNLIKCDLQLKKTLFGVITVSLIFTAVLGWVQDFWFFDLTSLKYLGWDDHLGRITGTFLDPTFAGITFVFAFFTVLLKLVREKRKIFLFLSLFFLLSIAFTYSRASFLSLLAGGIAVTFLEKKIRVKLLFLGLFVAILIFLPRSKGEGVRLERTRSIEARVGNYRETLQIFRQYTVLGVGMNNLCSFRVKMSGQSGRSHSCGGSDSSLLYILATTGVVGFFVFSNLVLGFFRSISSDYYGNLTKICIISLGIHSIFANSLFYPWVIGFASLLLAASVRE